MAIDEGDTLGWESGITLPEQDNFLLFSLGNFCERGSVIECAKIMMSPGPGASTTLFPFSDQIKARRNIFLRESVTLAEEARRNIPAQITSA